jgi:diaminohydroxyphosphoribosylaminopyrimidine deaminase/5-amino-6-(5-phosphoribosylamino)uracil reductase
LDRIEELLLELGRRRMTNVLVEGGARLLGNLFDARAVDEVHVYIGPIIVGGAAGISAVLGAGLSQLADGGRLSRMTAEPFDGDIHIHALVDRD